MYKGKLYSFFKKDLAEIIIDEFEPIQNKYNELINNKDYLYEILKKGSEYSQYQARKTLSKVYRKVGFINRNI